VIQPSTRKHFFAKLLGTGAAVGVISNSFGNSPAAAQEKRANPVVSARRFEVRADARSVARRADSI